MRVRLVVPTSRRMAFDLDITSGMRKEPPISTNSPRETMTSPFSASVLSARRTAAALLLTTMVEIFGSATRAEASASTRASTCSSRSLRNRRSTCTSRVPRSPVSRSNSRLEYPAAIWRMCSSAESGSGARPRLVCRMTPVALMTVRSEYFSACRTRRATALSNPERAKLTPLSSRRLAAISSRSDDRTARTASVTGIWPSVEMSAANSGLRKSSSTEGSLRYRSVLACSFTEEDYPTSDGRAARLHTTMLLAHFNQSVALVPAGSHVTEGCVYFRLRNFCVRPGQDRGGLALGSFEQLAVPDQIGHLEARHAGLARAEEFTRPTQL